MIWPVAILLEGSFIMSYSEVQTELTSMAEAVSNDILDSAPVRMVAVLLLLA